VAISLDQWNANPILGLWHFELKVGTLFTSALGNINTNFGFSTPFCFQASSLPTDRKTDGRIGKTRNAAY